MKPTPRQAEKLTVGHNINFRIVQLSDRIAPVGERLDYTLRNNGSLEMAIGVEFNWDSRFAVAEARGSSGTQRKGKARSWRGADVHTRDTEEDACSEANCRLCRSVNS
jgi:hypothetical protein